MVGRFLFMLMASALWAQRPPAFEVASVKPNTSGRTMMRGGREPRFENHSLRRLLQIAYRLQDYAVSGPPWLDTASFDITAKMADGAALNQMPEMLRTLTERFKLVVHREEKEVNGFLLVVDKKGLRIQPVEPAAGGSAWGTGMLQARSTSMTDFAGVLAGLLQSPVKDQTGVAGVYDIKLKWEPDGSVHEALQEIGLKLQATKLPVQVLVVDHAERSPTEN
jgi:uncharacterized protein (TIGR03435 family)